MKKQANKNLISEVEQAFDEENQIMQTNYTIDGVNFAIFYVESLIDKQLFSSGILQPIERLKSRQGQALEQGDEAQNQAAAPDESQNFEQDSSEQSQPGASGENQNSEQSVDSQQKNTQQPNNRQPSAGSSQQGAEQQDENPKQNNRQQGSAQQTRQQGSSQQTQQSNGQQSSDDPQTANRQQGSSQQTQQSNGQQGGGISQNASQQNQQNGKTKSTEQNGGQSNAQQNISSVKQTLKTSFISISSVEESQQAEDIIKNILSGYVEVVFEDGALDCPIFGAEKRSVEEPPNSKVVKGPREGFVEDIFTNIGLIRKRIKSTELKIVDEFVGKHSNTHVSIFYVKDIARPEIVQKVREKIKKIDIDAIIDSYYIESFIEENHLKFFRRVGNTEKPDIFCAKIMEGRVGILVDGSPVALTVPFILFEDLQSAEDYYTIPTMATFARIMRFVGLIFAILVPGVYVALQSYNYRILPINFLITLLSSIEGLSFPPLIEILIVLFLFEVITEASVRMPSALGMALSIIGALALGNTAVDAGIISPPSIVIVAISSVALYIIPDQIAETRILRVLFTVIGGVIGLYGVVVSLIILTTFLCSIESFGVPYMTPLAPSVKSDKKDAFIKEPIQAMKQRPIFFAGKNKIRQGDHHDDK